MDWIALSGMKENYYHWEQELNGITLPGTMKDWFDNVGFTSVQKVTNVASPKGIDTLLEAHQAQASGYQVCLLVHAEAFDPTRNDWDKSWFVPDHWVVLSSLMQIARWDNTKKALGSPVFMNAPLIAELKKELAEAKSKAKDTADRHEQPEEQVECEHRIQFTVYSWGSDAMPVQGAGSSGSASLCYFLRHFFGYVKVKWPC